MRETELRLRILMALGAGGLVVGGAVACGSDGGTSASKGPDASTSDAADEGASEAAVEAGGDATPTSDGSDDASDAQADAPLTVRRPFLVGASLRSAEATARDDWGLDGPLAPFGLAIDAKTADALSASWLHDALQEHASIAAFARFTLHLLSAGAPPSLVAGAERAALDEVRHARACFALARRYSGRAVGPSALDMSGALGELDLASMAALSAEEGCVGETLGVLIATEQLSRASDPEVVAILGALVKDEMRHAELAWRFVRWAIDRGGEPVRRAVAASIRGAIARTREVPVRRYDVDLAAWHAHGRLTCKEARAASERGIRDVIEPCAAALLDASPEHGPTERLVRPTANG